MSGVEHPPIIIPSNHGGTQLPILLRPMESSDRAFVVETWVDSNNGRRCKGAVDARGQRKLVHALLDRCPTTIAAFDEDPNTIIGWACTDAIAVHYVYVRWSKDDGFRRKGIATLLLKDYLPRTDIIYTHAPSRNWQRRDTHTIHTTRGDQSIPGVPAGWTYDPFLAFEIAATVPRYRELAQSSAQESPRTETSQMNGSHTRDR